MTIDTDARDARKAKVRAAQLVEFEENDIAEDSPLRAMTLGLYDKIDSLNEDQASLMVDGTLRKVERLLSHLIQHDSEHRAACIQVLTLVTLTGYSNEGQREDHGWTAASDRRVNEVFEDADSAIVEAASLGMNPERRAQIEAIAETVKQRVAAGEEFDVVVAEEMAKAGDPTDVEFVNGAPTAKGEEENPDIRGLYL